MAKKPIEKTEGEESISGYFRRIFKENPRWLKTRSNDEVLKKWLSDHAGETEVPNRVKVGLQNIKSILRSKGRKRTAAKDAAAAAAAPPGSPAPKPRRPSKDGLEVLEEQIDECLTAARTLDREGLEDVINHLRRARNLVVWKTGQ